MLRIFRTEAFVSDIDQQIDWYLHKAYLDDVFAAELVQRFAAAVEEALEFLACNPRSRATASCALFRPSRLPRIKSL